MNHLASTPNTNFRAYYVSQDEDGRKTRSLLSEIVTRFIVDSLSAQGHFFKRIRITEEGLHYYKDGAWSEPCAKTQGLGLSIIGQVEACLASPKLSQDKKERFVALNSSFQERLPSDLDQAFSIFLQFWREQARLFSAISKEWEQKQLALRLEELIIKDKILEQLEEYRHLKDKTAAFQSFIHHCDEMLEVVLRRPCPKVEDKEPTEPEALPSPPSQESPLSLREVGLRCYPLEVHETIRAEKRDLSVALESYLLLIDAEEKHIAQILLAIQTEEKNKNMIYTKCKVALIHRAKELKEVSEKLRRGGLQEAIDHYARLAIPLNDIAPFLDKAAEWGQVMNNRLKHLLPLELKDAKGFFQFFQKSAQDLFGIPRPARVNGESVNVECLLHLYPLETSSFGNTYKLFEEALQGLYKFRNLVGLIALFMQDPENKKVFFQNLKVTRLEEEEAAYFFELFVPLYQFTEEIILNLSSAQKEWELQLRQFLVLEQKLEKMQRTICQSTLFDAPKFTGGASDRIGQIIEYLEEELEFVNQEALTQEIALLKREYEALHQKTEELCDKIVTSFNSEAYKNALEHFIEIKEISNTFQVFMEAGNVALKDVTGAIIQTYDALSKKPDHLAACFTITPFQNATSLFFVEVLQHPLYVHKNLIDNELIATFLAAKQHKKSPEEVLKSEKERAVLPNSAVKMALNKANAQENTGRILQENQLKAMLERVPARKPIRQDKSNPDNGISLPIQNNRVDNGKKRDQQPIFSIKDSFNLHLITFQKIKILKKQLDKSEEPNVQIYAKLTRLYENLSLKEAEIEAFLKTEIKKENRELTKISTDLRAYFARMKEAEIAPKKE